MEKELNKYRSFVESEIEKIKQAMQAAKTTKEREMLFVKVGALQEYHDGVVRSFQHERLVHLIVTLFFACLWILSGVGLVALALLATTDNLYLLGAPILGINFILLILEIFYVSHYYKLENGTQKLYKYSRELHDLSNR